MNFIKKNKGIIGTIFVAFVLLAIAYFAGESHKKTENVPFETTQISKENTETGIEQNPPEELPPETEKAEDKEEALKAETEDQIELYCTLSVRCDTILSDISRFNADKIDILPKNGVIFAEKKVDFTEGESVFDLLLREMKDNKIHLEFVNTPVYGSVYIEGIGNIYEFDAGELSGWMYRVNGEFPNFGCSKYILKQGDKVEFVYTCDLGKDVGGEYAKGQGDVGE